MTATLPKPIPQSMDVPAAFGPGGGGHMRVDHPNRLVSPDPAPFLHLRILAECYFDTQENRISCVNRMERGGVPPDVFVAQIEGLTATEHQLELALIRQYRTVVRGLLPGVDAWQQREKGVGEKLLARLLGHMGHPRFAQPYHWDDRKLVADPPFERTVAQLRSYCGHGDPSRKKRKGMSQVEAFALGNPHLKMLVHLLAEATMKRTLPMEFPEPNSEAAGCADLNHQEPNLFPRSRHHAVPGGVSVPDHNQFAPDTQPGGVVVGYTYRFLYEQRRAQTTERTHASDCVRCGPSGKPALVGSPWSAAHQHADALRVIGKAILRDLWEAAH